MLVRIFVECIGYLLDIQQISAVGLGCGSHIQVYRFAALYLVLTVVEDVA